jgi:phosphate transport system permease protein
LTAESPTIASEAARISALVRRTTPLMYRWLGDHIFLVFITLFGLTVMALAIALAVVLYGEGAPAINRFGFFGFLTGTTWDPALRLEFGALPFLIGTLVTSVVALALSFLPALAVAIFSAEYAPRWIAHIIDGLVDLIAAVPSVVVGIWGIFVFAPWMRETFYMPIYLWAADNQPDLLPILGSPIGYGMTTAVIVLSLMIIPFTAALSRDALRLVPREQREAALALGATRWEVIRMAVIPYARGGIIAGAILSFGRAIGETMAVAMLIGNKNTLPFDIFGAAATMPSVIVNEFREAVEDLHLAALMAIGFYLFLISLIVNLFAAYLQRKWAVSGSRTI